MKQKTKTTIKEKLINILKSYKLIICISFIINIILLNFSYNLMTNNHEYVFNGSNQYIEIKEGLIVLNNDLNTIYGNNIKYINETDYEIKSLNMGYYIKNNEDYIELLDEEYEFEESMKLSEVINNFTNLNYIEKSKNSSIFTLDNVNHLNNDLYFILKAKGLDNDDINFELKLNITKISKY